MQNYSVYLAGPIAGLSYTNCTDWRDLASEWLDERIAAFSPMRAKAHLSSAARITNTNEGHPLSTAKAVNTRDRFDVERCDALLVYLVGAKTISIGTVMEMAWAHLLRKPMVVVIEKEGNPHDGHPMLEQCFDFRVETLEEGIWVLEAVLLPTSNPRRYEVKEEIVEEHDREAPASEATLERLFTLLSKPRSAQYRPDVPPKTWTRLLDSRPYADPQKTEALLEQLKQAGVRVRGNGQGVPRTILLERKR